MDCDSGVTAQAIDDYLKKKGSKLSGKGATFISSGRGQDVDPRLLVALAGAETTFAAEITMGEFNAWNWLWNRKDPSNSAFTRWEHGIQSVANGLRRLYLDLKLSDGKSIYEKYCDGPGCAHGLKNLESFLNELGADANNLEFPCKK